MFCQIFGAERGISFYPQRILPGPPKGQNISLITQDISIQGKWFSPGLLLEKWLGL